MFCGAGTGLTSYSQLSEYLVSEKLFYFINVGDAAGELRQVQELRVDLHLL